MPKANSPNTTVSTPSPYKADTVLISACHALLAADTAFNAACTDAEGNALNHYRHELLAPLLAMRATSLEGMRAKARVVGVFYDWIDYKDAGCDLVASMLFDLGVTVPYGTAAV
jgi:hypothetical protein